MGELFGDIFGDEDEKKDGDVEIKTSQAKIPDQDGIFGDIFADSSTPEKIQDKNIDQEPVEKKGFVSKAVDAGKTAIKFGLDIFNKQVQKNNQALLDQANFLTKSSQGFALSSAKTEKEKREIINNPKFKQFETYEEYEETLPIIRFFNSKTGKAIVGEISEQTSNIPIKLAAKIKGKLDIAKDAVTGNLSLKDFANLRETSDRAYEEAYSAFLTERNDPSNPAWQKFLFELQDTGIQSGIGILLSLGTAALTRNPSASTAVSSAYYTALSADEQIQKKGKVDSLGNIAIDVIGDQMINKVLGGVLKSGTGSSIKEALKSAGIEGSTEVLQSLTKFANDYGNAITAEEKNAILKEAKEYVTSGAIAMEFAVGSVVGGVADVAVGGGIDSSVQPTKTDTKEKKEIQKNITEIELDNTEIDKAIDELAELEKTGDIQDNQNATRALELRDTIEDYTRAFNDKTQFVPSEVSKTPLIDITTSVLPDGKVAVKFSANTETNGISSMYDFNQLFTTKKEATKSAQKSIIKWAKNQEAETTEERNEITKMIDFAENPNKQISRKIIPDTPQDRISQIESDIAFLDPDGQIESETLAEFEEARAGKRFGVGTLESPDAVAGSQKSTFPKWVPSHLRLRALFNKVQADIVEKRIPKAGRELELYTAFLNRTNERLGIQKFTEEDLAKVRDDKKDKEKSEKKKEEKKVEKQALELFREKVQSDDLIKEIIITKKNIKDPDGNLAPAGMDPIKRTLFINESELNNDIADLLNEKIVIDGKQIKRGVQTDEEMIDDYVSRIVSFEKSHIENLTVEDAQKISKGLLTEVSNDLDRRAVEKRRGIEKKPEEKKISDGEKSLAEEAKKFNTVEEFTDSFGEKMFHGSPVAKDIKDFDLSKSGSTKAGISRDGGIFFSNTKSMAKNFAGKLESTLGKGKAGVIEARVDTKNFLGVSADFDVSSDYIKSVKEMGYDGIKWNRGSGIKINNKTKALKAGEIPEIEYIVFEPSKIKTKEQLTEIFEKSKKEVKPRIKDDVIPEKTPKLELEEQAKGFDTVEEFLKAQGDPVFHGTPFKFNKFEIGKNNNTVNETNTIGIWFTDNKKVAKEFSDKFTEGFMGIEGSKKDVGGTVKEVYLDIKNPKIYKSKPVSQKITEQIEKLKKDEVPFYKINSLTPDKKRQATENNAKIKKTIDELKLQHDRDSFEQFMDDRDLFAFYGNDINKKKGFWEERYVAHNKEKTNKDFVDSLKKQGFDAMILEKTTYDAQGSEKGEIDQIAVFNPSDIKTKEQLIDIFNKAHKEKVPEKKPEDTSTKKSPPPVQVKGAIKKSRAFERVSERLGEYADFEANYNRLDLADDTAKAIEFVEKFPKEAKRIALGLQGAPVGVTETAISIALAEKAFENNDYQLQAKLERSRSLRQTRRGQEIVAERGRFNENSPHFFIQQVIAARLQRAGKTRFRFSSKKKKGSSDTVNAKLQEGTSDIKQKVKKRLSSVDLAQNIINNLTC